MLNAVLYNQLTRFQQELSHQEEPKGVYALVQIEYSLDKDTLDLQPYVSIFFSKASEHYKRSISLVDWLEEHKEENYTSLYQAGSSLQYTFNQELKDGEK